MVSMVFVDETFLETNLWINLKLNLDGAEDFEQTQLNGMANFEK